MKESEKEEHSIDRFLSYVADLAQKEEQGKLNALRRATKPKTEQLSYQMLMPYWTDFAKNDTHRIVYQTIAHLASLLVREGMLSYRKWDNIGTALREISRKRAQGNDSGERMLRRISDSPDTKTICERAVHICRLAIAQSVPVNLRNLYWDLYMWEVPEKRQKIRLRWAGQFFRNGDGVASEEAMA